jgi:signal transduction histidine kinase/ActR/RegA family two-component response regulator
MAHQAFLDQLPESIGLVLNTIEANTLTENLLKQSQSQAEELLAQQEELRESNEDLGRQARLLADRNSEAEQKNLEVEESKRLVEEKAGQLAVSSKYKSEFIANMSHELRTPLNSLLILAEQLESNFGNTMTDAQVGYASVIRASGNDLLDLLNSILELAKVESGTVTAALAELKVDHFRTALVREFDHVARGKGIDYAVEVAPGTPEHIVTDPQRVHQILKNLLDNAFKFTDSGQVHVHIGMSDHGWDRRTRSLAEAPSVIAMSVRDSGIGIPKDEHARIFEAFAQADGSITRQYGGTGLGLSISRELADLMGGQITVASTFGIGSTFTLYLPLGQLAVASPAAKQAGARADRRFAASRAPAPARDAVRARARYHGPEPEPLALGPIAQGPVAHPVAAHDPLAGTKVLVVDDDFRNSFSMTVLLERVHAEVTVAESGPAALAALETVPGIAIVLMDIMMPLMDGYETIRVIRSIDAFKALPIIAVTGKVVPGEHQRCVEAGANDYIPKPVDTVELLTVMRPYLPITAPAQLQTE